MLENTDMSKYIDIAVGWVMSYAPKVIGALLTLWIWFKIIALVIKLADKAMSKAKIDKALKNLLSQLFLQY